MFSRSWHGASVEFPQGTKIELIKAWMDSKLILPYKILYIIMFHRVTFLGLKLNNISNKLLRPARRHSPESSPRQATRQKQRVVPPTVAFNFRGAEN